MVRGDWYWVSFSSIRACISCCCTTLPNFSQDKWNSFTNCSKLFQSDNEWSILSIWDRIDWKLFINEETMMLDLVIVLYTLTTISFPTLFFVHPKAIGQNERSITARSYFRYSGWEVEQASDWTHFDVEIERDVAVRELIQLTTG